MNALDPRRTALLLMDFQGDVVSRYPEKVAPALERAAGLMAAARAAQVPAIHVVVGFRPGYPELNPRNASSAAIAQGGRFVATTPGADISPLVRPEDGEVVVVKHRVSAFAGTDLEVILRAKGIDTLVLTGVATSGVVLSTVRHATDADYQVVVAKDACADADDEVHRVLTEKVFVRQTTVATAAEVAAAFGKK